MSDHPPSVERRAARADRHPSQFRLLRERRFAPFFWTQFCGAMNDNVFKIGFISLVTYQAARFPGIDPKTAQYLISAAFIVPSVLFSATSGQIADRYDRALLTRWVKTFEIAVMLVGAAGFWLHSAGLLYACTFLMGLHSTVFGPVKYAYLPQHLREQELVGGNGLVESGTFVAILLGTIVGGLAAGVGGGGSGVTDVGRAGDAGSLAGTVGAAATAVTTATLGANNVASVGGIDGAALWLGGLCLVIALTGRVVSGFVPACAPAQPGLKIDWNPLTGTWRNLKLARRDKAVFRSLLGISWMWFFGATLISSFFVFARDVLGGNENVSTLLLTMFSVGMGVGSLLCERLSHGRIEIGLVPLGSIGLSVFTIDLFFASHALPHAPHLLGVAEFLRASAHWRVLADLFLLALFGGLYGVPLYAMIQSRSEPGERARIIASNNILNALFMIASALMGVGLTHIGVSIPDIFLVTALLNIVVAAYIYSLVPEFLWRFVAWVLAHTFYRIRLVDVERIPATGAAVLVCNHVSFVDAVIIMAESPRPIRFVMDHQIFRTPLASWVFRQARAIPIAPAHENAALLAAAYEQCAQALEAGELVCIFPEGKLTRTGEINTFRHGVTEILKRVSAPVVPMALRGLWGSTFSRHAGSGQPKAPRVRLIRRLTLAVAEPLAPADATPERLQQIVEQLRGARR